MSNCPNCAELVAELAREQELNQRLRDEMTRIGAAAEADMASWAANLTAKDRQIGKLKKDLAREQGEDPEANRVRDLLEHFKRAHGKSARFDIEPGGKRWKTAYDALKRLERVEKKVDPDGYQERAFARAIRSIDGLALVPWYSQARGRTAEKHDGAKKVADVEHALGDEVRQARCEAYVDEHRGVEPEPAPVPELDVWLFNTGEWWRMRHEIDRLEHALAVVVQAAGGDWPTRGGPLAGAVAVARAALGYPVPTGVRLELAAFMEREQVGDLPAWPARLSVIEGGKAA